MKYEDAEQDRMLTAEEVAATLRVSKMTVYRLAESGVIESVRVGRSIRLSERSLNAHLNSQET